MLGFFVRQTEKLFGAHVMGEAQRKKLRMAQVRSVTALLPIMIASTAVLGLGLLWIAKDQANSTIAYMWGAVLLAIIGRALHIWYQYHTRQIKENNTSVLLRISILRAGILGLFWGTGVYGFSISAPIDIKIALLVIGIASIAAGVVSFISLPLMVIVFTTPVYLGVVLGLLSEPSTPIAFYVLVAWFFMATPVAAIKLSGFFVSYSKALIDAQEQTALSKTLLSEFQKNSHDWLWATDEQGHLVQFDSPELELDLAAKKHLINFLKSQADVEDANVAVVEDVFSTRKTIEDIVIKINGLHGTQWWRINGHPIFEKEGAFSGYMGTCSDVTSEKLAEQRILTLAESDTLTGLMNRTAFSDRLMQAVANLERYGRPFIVLHLNFDGFKLINDTRGHIAGDRVLAEASERIADEVRDGDCVARLGGDEFAILMDSQGDAGSAARLASRMISEVTQPYHVDGEDLLIGLSIGIAMAPLNGTRPDQLLRNADLALYRAKADGRGVFRFFENTMDAELRERRMLESELRDAIKNEELVLFFQPLVDAQSRETLGFESLIRWQHPIRGLLSPVEFIDIAEASSLIGDLGRWTIRKACSTAKEWPGQTFVAVNLSANHFMRSDIVAEVAEILEETGFEPERLELEITESLLITNSDDVIEKINNLKAIGVSVAMDDFGTGYSSLSYLMAVPFDKLKIDKSFVDTVSESESGRTIVKMISTLARELKLKVTAEGVETVEQADFLEEVQCDQLQGYYFSRPMPNEDLPAYLLNSATKHLKKTSDKKQLAKTKPA